METLGFPMESMRMKRMVLILKKALDCSVSASSAVDLQKFFVDECGVDSEIIKELFEENGTERKENLIATVLQDLRHKIEVFIREFNHF